MNLSEFDIFYMEFGNHSAFHKADAPRTEVIIFIIYPLRTRYNPNGSRPDSVISYLWRFISNPIRHTNLKNLS